MMALKTDADLQVLLFRFLGGGEHLLDSCAVNRDRFFREDIFSLTNRFFEMNGTESGRSSEDGDVSQRDRVFISVETNKFAILGNVNFVFVLYRFFDFTQTAFQTVFECVSHRDQFDFAVCGKRLAGGSRTTTAAADQRDLDGVVTGGVDE